MKYEAYCRSVRCAKMSFSLLAYNCCCTLLCPFCVVTFKAIAPSNLHTPLCTCKPGQSILFPDVLCLVELKCSTHWKSGKIKMTGSNEAEVLQHAWLMSSINHQTLASYEFYGALYRPYLSVGAEMGVRMMVLPRSQAV